MHCLKLALATSTRAPLEVSAVFKENRECISLFEDAAFLSFMARHSACYQRGGASTSDLFGYTTTQNAPADERRTQKHTGTAKGREAHSSPISPVDT